MHLQVRGRGRRPHPVLSGHLGVLGGTFNPPHVAHLVCAQEARAQLGLNRVLLVPVAVPPHKEAAGDPGADVRLELCRAAAQGDPGLEVDDREVRRGGPSYTVDTLEELHAEHPGAELTFIVGGDMALSLPDWRDPAGILRLARLGIAERAGARRAEIEERLAPLGAEVDFFAMPRLDVSSSDVRARVAAGRPIRYLVPARVEQAIASRGLYAP